MHELDICLALMTQVESIATDNNADRVAAIHLGMGPLAGVEEKLLRQAYPVASADTIAANAELFIHLTPVRVRCSRCDRESEAEPNRQLCKHCGDWRTQLISGDELLLVRVELDRKIQNAPDALH